MEVKTWLLKSVPNAFPAALAATSVRSKRLFQATRNTKSALNYVLTAAHVRVPARWMLYRVSGRIS